MFAFARVNKAFEEKRKRLCLGELLGFAMFGGYALYCFLGDFSFVKFLMFAGILWGIKNVLKQGFQKEIESEFIRHGKEVIDGVKIDIDNGIDENVLVKSKFLKGFDGKESFNVIEGKGFKLSEEQLYKKLFKNDCGNINVFDGVVIEIDDCKFEGRAKFRIENGREIFDGECCKEQREYVFRLMRIFGASGGFSEVIEGKLYVFFDKVKLFYQFGVWSKVDVMKCVSKFKIIVENVVGLRNTVFKG